MKIITEGNVKAISFNDSIEEYAEAQIKNIMKQDWCQKYNPKIRLMPDVHPGKVGPIGLTMTISNKAPIMPGLLGPDIGCGVSVYKINTKKKLDLQKLDKVIYDSALSDSKNRKYMGNTVELSTTNFILNHYPSHYNIIYDPTIKLDYERIKKSLGTLGGGNHFIEVDKDKENNLYLVIHTGSRQYGKQVYDYFMKEGQKQLKDKGINIPFEMTYLEGELKDKYILVCEYCNAFALYNRDTIAYNIKKKMKLDMNIIINKPHNFIRGGYITHDLDTDKIKVLYRKELIIRKGAQSADLNERVIIPINMKEGSILGYGTGDSNWNNSAPHGSGRVYSRTEVSNHYTLNQFKKDMKDIYSSSIRRDTLDEAPIAYRSMDQVLPLIEPTVYLGTIIKPIYNFKNGKEV